MELLATGAAFIWHVGDLVLNKKSSSRKQMVWIGIGVGWSALFLGLGLYRRMRPQYTTTHGHEWQTIYPPLD
jgi:hypothetical protein